ncbi:MULTISPECIES: phospholipid-binding protein [unclassified Brucella]|uniref:phospholipid-binding protein n=1 Tax=unclassified Brucella TaxID=2632610 RepID=UPI000972D86A|nr:MULTISPECIES: phospholipid-binding protein [unclassified Brucella]APX69025.1 phospholipid-binding protein [Brucella sp. 09RB8471]MRN79357.1 phospholipid-binding protein [Brucella sp. 10RB9210]
MRKLVLAATLSFCATGAMAADLNVSFNWGPTKKCFDPKSPPISVTNVPAGTKTLEIRMIDRNASFNHGGGKVAYTGKSQLPYGAFRYKGPCPPDGVHHYKITVNALDADGKKLASGSATQPFPKK